MKFNLDWFLEAVAEWCDGQLIIEVMFDLLLFSTGAGFGSFVLLSKQVDPGRLGVAFLGCMLGLGIIRILTWLVADYINHAGEDEEDAEGSRPQSAADLLFEKAESVLLGLIEAGRKLGKLVMPPRP